ncbi:deoxyuridine 5'-triphosphate nucleotidohydrolase [Pacmanvirus S19]|nr:deoxyuridine 5'-triphosphate nucleotidohydrolase [Pacmanvirus S19]
MSLFETVKFKKLHDDAIIPARATEQSAGYDLYALQDTLVTGGEGSVIVPTGIAVQLLKGTYGRIAMRSGLSVKEHLAVSAGVIDLDYENKPIGVVTFCTKIGHSYLIKRGEKFAQLVPERVCYAKAEEVSEMIPRYGEHAGYGSTGKT